MKPLLLQFLILILTLLGCTKSRYIGESPKKPLITLDTLMVNKNILKDSMFEETDKDDVVSDRVLAKENSSKSDRKPASIDQEDALDESQGFGGSGGEETHTESVRIVKETKIVKETNTGRIVYHIPDTMRVNVSALIRIRIAKTEIEGMTLNMGGVTGSSPIRTSETMEINLVDPEERNFKIIKTNSDRQMIEDSSYTEWLYTVTPLVSGRHSLILVVSIIKNGNRKETVYSDLVYVRANAPYVVKSFWEKYWQWAFSTLIIPFVIWFYNKRKKDK